MGAALRSRAEADDADYDAAVRDNLVAVLYLDGNPAALIEMKPEPDHLLVVNAAVSLAYQGRRHGRALLAEGLARALRLNELRLYTSVHLTENVKLYERVGYRIQDRPRGGSLSASRRLRPHEQAPTLST
jgi:ribosomal protein S18 acetylase RimI-like enzyme